MGTVVRIGIMRLPFFVFLISVALFILDLRLPLGFAIGVFYVGAVVATAGAPGAGLTYAASGLCTILILAGTVLSPAGAPPLVYLTNRTLSLLALWIAAVLVARNKRAAAARAESEQRFHELGDKISEVFCLMSPQEEKLLYVSPAFERTWGLPRIALDADPRSWREVVHSDDRPVVEGALDRARAGHATDVEYRIKRPDGSTRSLGTSITPVFNGSGKVDHLACVTRDVTSQREFANALCGTNALLRSTLDSLSAHIALLDESGQILEVNQAWRRFGRENGLSHPAGGVGGNYFQVCRAAAAEGVDAAQSVLDGSEALNKGAIAEFSTEYECSTDTSERWFAIRMTRFAGEGPARFVVVHEDITNRKLGEAMAGERSYELARANRLDTLGHLAAALAHELSHPLSAVTNYLHGCRLRLSEKGFQAAEFREALDAASQEARRASHIVKRLRHFIRDSAPSRAIMDVNLAVGQIARLLDAHARYNRVSLSVHLDPDPPNVLIDEVQIQQVLVNLVQNAIDAITGTGNDGGTLTIATVRCGTETVDITVADNGPGIPADRLADVFVPFKTTKPDGLGLGLPISRAIVEAHEGTLQVTSTEGAGCTFRIRLPIAENTDANRAKTDSVRCG